MIFSLHPLTSFSFLVYIMFIGAEERPQGNQETKGNRMNNAIEINGITIEAKFADGYIHLDFVKDSKVVKTVKTTETYAKANLSKIVRPESMSKVLDLVASISASDEAKAYWTAQVAEADSYEVEYQERTGHYEAHKRMMDRTMSVQG